MIGRWLYLSAVKSFCFFIRCRLTDIPPDVARYGEAGLDGFAEVHVFKVVPNLVLVGDKRIKHKERFFIPAQPEPNPVDEVSNLCAHEGFNKLAAPIGTSAARRSGLGVFLFLRFL